jgi:hypothetical protein
MLKKTVMKPLRPQYRTRKLAVPFGIYISSNRLFFPRTTPWTASSSEALKNIFGQDDVGAQDLALFKSFLQPGTLKNYGSNLARFFEFCELHVIPPLDVSPVDIARYIAWLEERETVATMSMQPYLSAIHKFLQDHARPLVDLGPLVSGVRKGLDKCQRDESPTP